MNDGVVQKKNERWTNGLDSSAKWKTIFLLIVRSNKIEKREFFTERTNFPKDFEKPIVFY